MLDFDKIFIKLKNKEYENIDDLIKDVKTETEKTELKENPYGFLLYYVDNLFLAYPVEKFPELFKDDDFIKSLITSFRIIVYIENNILENYNYNFLKCEKTHYPLVGGVFYLNKGSMSIISDATISKIKFSYCRRGVKNGLPSICGECKITSYVENTKEILDALFSIGN